MYLIQDVLVSEDIFEEYFMCNLDACKGACCVAGDFGAPLDNGEEEILNTIYPEVKPFIDQIGIETIEKQGTTQTYEDDNRQFRGTSLRPDGACAFLHTSELGIAYCGIESAYRAGTTNFKKPMSCELYPIRLTEIPEHNYTALNYDRWEVCNPACKSGQNKNLKLYEFLRTALIRKFDERFYEDLVHGAKHYEAAKEDE